MAGGRSCICLIGSARWGSMREVELSVSMANPMQFVAKALGVHGPADLQERAAAESIHLARDFACNRLAVARLDPRGT